jgi:predicted secreted protein
MKMATKTAHDLLLEAPDEQVKRCQLAWKAVAAGDWLDAAHYLRNAANEEGNTDWAMEARALADTCMNQVDK